LSAFITQVVDGVGVGSVYSLLAMAIVLIFRATRIVNVAQGEFAVLSTFIAWQFLEWGINLYLAVGLTILISFLIGVTVYRTVVRYTEDRDHLVTIVVTIGMLLVIHQLGGWLWGVDVRSFPSVFGDGTTVIGGISFSHHTLATVAVLIVIAALFQLFVTKTRLGLAMRAAAESDEWSRLAGVPASRMFAVGWGISLGVGAVAGVLAAPTFFLDPNMLLGATLYAFAAAAIGGFDSVAGAAIGGVIVGVTENLAGAYIDFIGSDLKITIPLLLMFAVLTIRPNGLFGTREVSRV